MRASYRWILALAAGIVVAGAVGIAVHHPAPKASSGPPLTTTPPTTAPPATPPTTTPIVPPTTTAGLPGASSAALAANLLTPTDLGGFYSLRPAAADALLASAPCLAGLSPSASQSGRAVTGLLGPDAGSVPAITEVVLSYPGAAAASVYRSLAAALRECPSLAMTWGGTAVRVPMAAGTLASVGDASSAYQGQFRVGGRAEQLGLAVVLAGHDVLAIAYIDTVPPSNALFGDLPSTVSAALGKEA